MITQFMRNILKMSFSTVEGAIVHHLLFVLGAMYSLDIFSCSAFRKGQFALVLSCLGSHQLEPGSCNGHGN